ncbi:hypothetical protein MUN74_12705 [Agromyces endophyticus]|uniref:hypothetical protein n=1 Tax=Agromyces sp. H17E-10 TaxID=2932244 RepID=UPI001FD1787A|nr:hypothetical protein [Agromyces sp. H17E-10]UOQ88146.1 hypothetical protein MUN74_12705 [Agromyces sp. H17E-10]
MADETGLLEIAAWKMAVGRLATESLPELATEALVSGWDSPALRTLAGQSPSDVRDSADLFRLALSELDVELPDAETAEWRLARHVAGMIVAGTLSGASGARELWNTYLNVSDNGDLRVFVGLVSELDDHPEQVDAIEAAIIAAAHEFVTRREPRRWIRLMAASGRSSLTQTSGHDDIEIDPATLGLTDELRSDLARWDVAYLRTLSAWPVEGGFETERDAERFVAAGRGLSERLQIELGSGYHVEYMPEPIRQPGVKLRAVDR